ncbi:MAG: hypothetical protein WC155_01915 [Candidatus Cloacimonadales bacterium]
MNSMNNRLNAIEETMNLSGVIFPHKKVIEISNKMEIDRVLSLVFKKSSSNSIQYINNKENRILSKNDNETRLLLHPILPESKKYFTILSTDEDIDIVISNLTHEMDYEIYFYIPSTPKMIHTKVFWKFNFDNFENFEEAEKYLESCADKLNYLCDRMKSWVTNRNYYITECEEV